MIWNPIKDYFAFEIRLNGEVITKDYGRNYRPCVFGLSARYNGFNYDESPELKTYVKKTNTSGYEYFSETVDDYFNMKP